MPLSDEEPVDPAVDLALDRRSRKTAPQPVEWQATDWEQDELRTYSATRQVHQGHPFRNLWRPSSAFLVGGGPSLQTVDAQRLRERGVLSLGVNNAAAKVHTSAMVFGDPPEKFHHGIFIDPTVQKWCPKTKLSKRVRAKRADGTFAWTRWTVGDCPNVVGYERTGQWDPTRFFKGDAANWGCNKSCVQATKREKIIFTFFTAFRILHYLGVRRVFLLGVDFHMNPASEQSYAFGDRRSPEVCEGNNRYYRLASEMLRELQPTFAQAGYEVYNCNPVSHLTIFPYVSFDQAIADCQSALPREPWDLSGWYLKPQDVRDGAPGP